MDSMRYPEPQFGRKKFELLNGKWDVRIRDADTGAVLDAPIEVPFCPESELSGIAYKGRISDLSYRKTFSASPADGEHVWLRFGAVDYRTEVFVNGHRIGAHNGGYTPFGFDVTRFLSDGTNELRVEVSDWPDDDVPSGKQSSGESHGCFYTRTTGIWQSVWLEYVPSEYVRCVKYFPSVDGGYVDVELFVEGEGEAEIEVRYRGADMGRAAAYAKGRTVLRVQLAAKHLWEIGHGRLYDVTLRFCGDEVDSYFGLREVRFEGRKFLLNGKSVFQRFVLDQGYNPQGLYTAPSDAYMIRDIELAQALGFNGARLHQKVFEPRFLYHCDRMGYMVWGEFPSWGVHYDRLQAFGAVMGEWCAAVERDFNHPSIVTWCPLNETWCELDDERKVRDVRFVDAMYAVTKAIDPTRPCVDVSGGYHGHKTDLYDFHDYHSPEQLEEHLRALTERDELIMDHTYAPEWAGETLRYGGEPSNASEYGGIAISDCAGGGADGAERGWGYRKLDGETFLADYEKLTRSLLACKKLSGFCYTQLYDIEQECNGLYTYDRRKKFSADAERRIREINLTHAAIEE